MSEAKRGRPRRPVEISTEGQRLLLDVDDTEAAIAGRLGVGLAIVGHWKRGRRLPDDGSRHRLELLLGIPRASWNILPGAAQAATTTTTATPTLPPGQMTTTQLATTLDIANARIDSITAALREKGLADTSRSRYEGTLAKLLGLRARLERDQEMLEDRIVREHPAWARTKAAVLAALKPFPEAAKAVADALVAAGDM